MGGIRVKWKGAGACLVAALMLGFSCTSSPVDTWKRRFDSVVRRIGRIPLSAGGVPADLEAFYDAGDELYRTAREWGYGRDLLKDLALTADSPAVRAACLRCLGSIGSREATYVLIHALDDPSPFAAEAAYRGVKKATGKNFGRDTERWLEWWRNKEKKDENE